MTKPRKKKERPTDTVPGTTEPEASAAHMPVSPKSYNAVVNSAALANIVLARCELKTDRNSNEAGVLRFIPGQIIHAVHDGDVAVAVVYFSAQVESGDTKVFDFKCAYAVSYEGVSGLESNAVKLFLKRVGVLACYPYFRALVAHMSWETQASLPPLPVIRGSRSTGQSDVPPRPDEE